MARALPAVGVVVALIIGILGGFFAATAITPQQRVVVTSVATQVVTTTATVGGGQPMTLTATITRTVVERPTPPKTIIIGATVPKTGSFSPVAGPFEKLYLAWQDLVNERGGLYVKQYGMRLPVKVVIYDDESNGETAARLYERLITVDKADILLGPYSTPVTLPVIDVVAKYGTPIVTTQAGAPPIYTRGLKNVFSAIDLISTWSYSYFDMIKAEGKARTIAFVIQDEAYGNGLMAGAKPKAQEIGLRIVAEEKFPVGTTDFTAIILRLKAADPDIVFVAGLNPGAAAFVKQALEQGLRPREYHVPQLTKPFLDTVGVRNANYFTGEWFWTEGIPYDGYFGREFWMEAMRRAGLTNDLYPWASVTWQALETVAAAIEKANSLKPEDLVDALEKTYVLTISGPTQLGRDFGQFTNVGLIRAFPVQLVDGRFRVIWPPEIRTAEHVYPTPWQ
ncbi:MAG: amino acid ABC transporter substrate-binding protein [Candidatus Caldarchaeum sp.]|nr:amino acid ABC transporter substrate-binding protein [Candidatus Caldarchaeum sp.]